MEPQLSSKSEIKLIAKNTKLLYNSLKEFKKRVIYKNNKFYIVIKIYKLINLYLIKNVKKIKSEEF